MKRSRRVFREQGYCIFRDLVPRPLLDQLRRESLGLVAEDPFQTRSLFKFHGSMVRVPYWVESFARLIALPATADVRERLDFPDVKWISGYVIAKPGGGEALWWHQDWWAWDMTCSAWPLAPQAFFMVYLQDTTEANGCLRVIPGSHRRRFDLHDRLPEAHSEEINHSADAAAFERHDREVSVPVRAGDVIVGDARLLHATHPNRTDQERVCITLWYAPDFRRLPLILQAKMAAQIDVYSEVPSVSEQPLLRELIPSQQGLPIPGPYNRRPGEQLQRRDAGAPRQSPLFA